ncbi:MAG: biosynthetic arginine decarboxylase, partial [Prevotellaceae bacterium]|nr:biosynthetic arginine decarboxylase [Prevotellaceae bacterium]
VDYDGTRSSNSESSVNYSIQEYVNDCVDTLVEEANENNIPHPNIITEGGRSLTAHHSVLIMEAMESVSLPQMPEDFKPTEDDDKLVHDLTEIWDNLTPRSMLEDWHDAQDVREEALDLFRHGIIDLKTRAQIESLFWAISREIADMAHHQKHVPDELRKLDKQMADKYFCNFSLFRSMPDSWGIDQLFPIMPISHLLDEPTRSATLQDITCDSDGKIIAYVNGISQTNYIPLHTIRPDEPYYIGVFLVGAYQEILGNMHNLFGVTNAVHISVSKDEYTIEQLIDGESIADVLEFVQYDPKKLVRRLEIWVSKAIKDKKISPAEGKEFISNYRAGLYGYTYLE